LRKIVSYEKILITDNHFSKGAEYDNQRYKIIKINPNDNYPFRLIQNIADFVYSFSLTDNQIKNG